MYAEYGLKFLMIGQCIPLKIALNMLAADEFWIWTANSTLDPRMELGLKTMW